ncbi:MAG: type II secretion system protein GspC [Candidatus Binatia bacterium]
MNAQRTLLTGGQLLLLGLGSLFAATTVNGIVAAALQPRPEVRLEDVEPEAPRVVKHPVAYYSPITERDIFNPPQPESDAPVAVSDLKAKLLGTAPGEGTDSFAIIEDQNTKKQELYRIGDQIQGRTLHRVEWDHVVLRNADREEILKIAEAGGGVPGVAVASAASETIQAISDNDYRIDRSEVDQAMQNLNQLFTQIRAVPHFQDGKASGFRLFAIRRNSIFEKIGLKNGDIVSSINGNELSDPARAMELFQQLKDEGRISVEVTRNRQPTTLSYEIR